MLDKRTLDKRLELERDRYWLLAVIMAVAHASTVAGLAVVHHPEAELGRPAFIWLLYFFACMFLATAFRVLTYYACKPKENDYGLPRTGRVGPPAGETPELPPVR